MSIIVDTVKEDIMKIKVRQDARMSVIVDTAKEDIMKLESDDVVVTLGGSSDNGKNDSTEALKHLPIK
jgi:hypothetical protein